MQVEQKQCPGCDGHGYKIVGLFEPRIVDCDFCGAKGMVFIDYEKTDAQRRLRKPTFG